EYDQSGNLIFVTSPQGDEFSIYHISKNKAGTIRLPNSKESPLHVTPIEDENTPRNQNLVALKLEGPRLTRLYAFSLEDCKWYPQDLKEPAAGVLNPIVSNWVAAYAQGRTIYAFDAQAKRWSILELPQEAPAQPDISVSFDSVSVEYDGHIYEFSCRTGEWKL